MEVQILPRETETKSMQLAVFILSIFVIFAAGTESSAQVDTGSMLLNHSGSNSTGEGVDSGRYQVRKEAEKLSPPEKATSKPKRKWVQRKITAEISNPAVEKSAQPASSPAPAIPTYADQVKELVSGKHESIEAYKEQVHPDDVRLNQLELTVVPGLLYYESKSNYAYRNYQSYSPFARVGAEIWWTPFIGLYGQYQTSVGADVVDNGALMSRTPATHELVDGGLDFRTFFGLSRRSNSIAFGVHYFEYKFGIPGDNAFRSKTKSAGVGIHFQARFPVAPSYSWTLGAKMEPRLAHTEYGTALGLQSGINPESSRLELFFGGEFKLSRQHQLVWSLSTSVEKNQFSGAANLTDPATGQTPTGVSVTQSLSMFSLGYRWGH